MSEPFKMNIYGRGIRIFCGLSLPSVTYNLTISNEFYYQPLTQHCLVQLHFLIRSKRYADLEDVLNVLESHSKCSKQF